MNQEHAFCLAGEKLLGLDVPKRGQLIRVLYSEIGRLLSHLLNVTTQAMDVGALTPPLWGFEEREKLMVFYERASGSRMHAKYFRFGGVHQDLPPKLIDDIYKFCETHPKVLDDIEGLLTDNRIFKQRNVDIGVVSLEDCIKLGFSGVMLRGSGAAWDLRKAQPYECYSELDFDIPIGKNGDNYDRYCIRVEEMRQAVKIMKQCCVPALSPTSPPALCPPPLTWPVAVEPVIIAALPLNPTSPPAVLSNEKTVPPAPDPMIVPLFAPTRPPAELFAPEPTLPVAKEVSIVPPATCSPTSPPRKPAWKISVLAPPVTAPVPATELVMTPKLNPTSPPAPRRSNSTSGR